MSNSEDFNALIDVIKAIPENQIRIPAIPVNVYLQEAEDLYHWAKDDAAELAKGGITAEMIEELPVRTGACREAQSLWFKDHYTSKEAKKLWDEQSPAAYDLRDELLHDFRYAFRDNTQLLGRVSEIADGTGHADMIQDLNDLAVLGRENPDPLAAINFDVTQLDTAAQTADAMAELLAQSNGDQQEGNPAKIIRDRAYTHLKQLVDDIRACGKYVFWKKPEKLVGYSSHYYRVNNRKTISVPSEESSAD
ncbi:hypothetical protein PbJCM13498_01270 [Prolixibacter bellariivorans]|uniref:Uncharacterized protein n=1 Tax=Prolixibacter bellariivorans TaxID=314319 RepID=A0A5M4AU44_9BACT|nr:hypothetical protein [Prolixibacter bellariivorans]GET31264.1 hypothetical protein PbJCM13498_01270 [Prolixibacter bellariivorans]